MTKRRGKMIETDEDIRDACEELMRLVTKVAGLKLSQVIRFMVDEQQAASEKMRAALIASRASLIACGFVGPGAHGSGDQEINIIDAALAGDGECAPRKESRDD